VDDDSQGEWFYWVSTGDPQTATNGAAYLNMDAATGNTISNLRFCYADQGVTTPVMPGELDVWDCQFFDCNYAIANLVPAFGSVDFLHNVLFAHCGAAVGASTNSIEIEAEHVTADAADFWIAGATPYKIGLTNSIIRGGFGNAGITINQKSAVNPSGRIFQKAEQGDYYLAADSALHGAGTTNVSPKLLAEFGRKTTSRPFHFPSAFQTGGNMVLFPQAPRYTNGPPDIGYWYDALDYTVASLRLAGGNLTVLPGTAIGVRNDYIGSNGSWTVYGIYVNCGFGEWLPGVVSFVTDFEPGDAASPTLDFRFSHFYLTAEDLHFCSGQSYDDFWLFSSDSSVNLNLQDCSLHNGQVNLGQPDDSYFDPDQVFGGGAVTWNNTLFDNVAINLDPTFYESGVDDQGLNVDLSFQAGNNLFRGGIWLILEPIPASAGNWVFEDNLFDKVDFVQDTASPLDFAYNAYWPKTASELLWPGYDAAQLQPTTTGDGFTDSTNEPDFTAPPPYQAGPFGHYYMPTNTILYQAGSRTADAAGFCQYTTRVDQTKELTGETVDIGLHYVAASNSPSGWVPLDTDGDGIPDYVEDANGNGVVDGNETSPYTQFTVPGVWDPTNSVYDNVDLSGDGLTGAMVQWLGITNPLLPYNPLQFPASSEPMIVSNTVQFDLNMNQNIDTNAAIIMWTVDGTTMNSAVYETNGQWIAAWDTTEITNGIHELNFEVEFAGDDDSTVVSSTLMNVQNVISFPDFIPIAGSAIYVQPQTVYVNGSWVMNVYDDQSNLFASLQGPVDGNGYCDDPDTLQPGISVSILDDQGNQLPSASYTIELAVSPSGGSGSGGSGSGGDASAQATKTIYLEHRWAPPGQWIITYQPIYNENSDGSTWLTEMMYSIPLIITAFYGPSQIPGLTMPFSLGSPDFVSLPAKWWGPGYCFAYFLGNPSAQNLYYFGHFDGMELGGSTNQSISISINNLETNLLMNGAMLPRKNAVVPACNAHPYRFVFIDGCSSYKSDLALAFGIPEVTTTCAAMSTQMGIPPRAFVGFTGWVEGGALQSFNQEHASYIAQFFNIWPQTDPATGAPFTLIRALEVADLNPATGNPRSSIHKQIKIWGCQDLPFK
jgi:hypothetical protein